MPRESSEGSRSKVRGGFCLSNIYDLAQFSVSRWHVKSLAKSAAVVEFVHRLQGESMAFVQLDCWKKRVASNHL